MDEGVKGWWMKEGPELTLSGGVRSFWGWSPGQAQGVQGLGSAS